LLGPGRASNLTFEQVGKLGVHLASRIECREPIGNVGVLDIHRAYRLERSDRPQVIPRDVCPEAAGLVPRG
jgi:hypothetical protein